MEHSFIYLRTQLHRLLNIEKFDDRQMDLFRFAEILLFVIFAYLIGSFSSKTGRYKIKYQFAREFPHFFFGECAMECFCLEFQRKGINSDVHERFSNRVLLRHRRSKSSR